VFVVSLLTFFAYFNCNFKKVTDFERVSLKMVGQNGVIDTATFILPKGSQIYISQNSSRSNVLSLMYRYHKPFQNENKLLILGVQNFKILK